MINIGYDVEKSNLDIHILGKFGRFKNDKNGIDEFIKLSLKSTDSRIILEPSRGYKRNLLATLYDRNYDYQL